VRSQGSEKAAPTIQVHDLPWGLRVGLFAVDVPATGMGDRAGAGAPRRRMRIRMLVASAAGISLAGFAYGLHKDFLPLTNSPRLAELKGRARSELGHASTVRINVPATIVAEPSSQIPLELSIVPMPDALAGTSLVLSGSCPEMSLSAGYAAETGTGEWEIPLSQLGSLALKLPAAFAGECEIVISLVSGQESPPTFMAYAKTKLIINAPHINNKPVEIDTEASRRLAAAVTPTGLNKSDPSPTANETRIRGEIPRSLSGGPQSNEQTRPPPPDLTPQERIHAEKLIARGLSALEDGTVAAARQFFLRAAEANLARGALLLAATYDPQELQHLGVLGVQPNLDLARKWYDRARNLGAPEADDRLARLRQSETIRVFPRN
jgi:hypothetical protein